MNNFIKRWLVATCAPESIVNIKNAPIASLDVIKNEDSSLKVFVLSNDDIVIAIGKDYESLTTSKSYNHDKAITEITKLLKLNEVYIKTK